MPLGARAEPRPADENAPVADGVDAGQEAAGDEDGEDKGAEIVTLDRFRKR
jgi:hypothetical protein